MCLGSSKRSHESIHEVLLLRVENGNTHVYHIIVRDPNRVQLLRIISQHRLRVKKLLFFYFDLRLDIYEAFEVFDGAIGFALNFK